MGEPILIDFTNSPSAICQMRIFPSWPPEAINCPLGAMEIVLIWAEWPTKVFLNCMVCESQTLMVLSHPPVTIRGVLVSGENLTVETQSECPFCSTVYLQSPTVFQILMKLSLPPEAICLLSGEKATVSTSLVWETNRLVVIPFTESQSLRVPSHEALKMNLESCERAISWMKWLCPYKNKYLKHTFKNFSWYAPFFIVTVNVLLWSDIPDHDGFVWL